MGYSLQTKLGDAKLYGVCGVMGYMGHGLRGFQLYVVDMQCNPAPHEMDKDQPQHNEGKLLLVYNTILIHTSQECNLCAL